VKILHCADIHLGRRPVGGVGEYSNKRYDDYFKAFGWAIDTAIVQQVSVVLIAGDLFDRKELIPEVLERTEALLQKLKDAHIATLLIEGNHDNITPGKEDDSWIIYLENKGFLMRGPPIPPMKLGIISLRQALTAIAFTASATPVALSMKPCRH